MKSTTAWAWLTAGVLALGLNGIYQDVGATLARQTWDKQIARVAERTQPALALAAGRADWFAASVESASSREGTTACRRAAGLQTSFLHSINLLAAPGAKRLEEISARHEAALARLEGSRQRVAARLERVRVEPASFNSFMCPRVRIAIPRVEILTPMVRVEVSSAGPS